MLSTDAPTIACPSSFRPAGKSYCQHRLLLGTHTSEQDQNYLQIAQVQLPNREVELDESKYDEDKGGEGLSW